MIQAVLFDYGGVLAEEGYANTLRSFAAERGLEPEAFFRLAVEIIYRDGYIVGRSGAATYIHTLFREAGIAGDPNVGDLKARILAAFEPRPSMFALVDALRAAGIKTAILSDQVDWLDELEARDRFFQRFDLVFNSYHVGLSKRERACYDNALSRLGVAAAQALFIDDSPLNVANARAAGLHAILYTDEAGFRRDFAEHFPGWNPCENPTSA